MAPAKEVRITDEKTGGMKGQKSAQLGAMDPQALMVVAEVAGFGTVKYDRYNFAKGFKWSLSYDALQRHLHAFWGGENLDPESKLPHLAHACWHTLCLLTFSLRSRGTDDRFPTGDFMESQTHDERATEDYRIAVDQVATDRVGGTVSEAIRAGKVEGQRIAAEIFGTDIRGLCNCSRCVEKALVLASRSAQGSVRGAECTGR